MSRPAHTVVYLPLRRLILTAVGVALLAFLVWWPEPETSAAPVPTGAVAELRETPPDAWFFYHVQVSQILEQPLGKQLLHSFTGRSAYDEEFRERVRSRGIEPAECENMAIIGGTEWTVRIFTTKKPMERAALLRRTLDGDPREVPYKGKRLYLGEQGGKDKRFRDDDFDPREFRDKDKIDYKDKKGRDPVDEEKWTSAMYFLNDRSFLQGNARDIKHFLDTAQPVTEKHRLSAMVARAGKQQLTVGVEMPPEARAIIRRSLRFNYGFDGFLTEGNLRPLFEYKTALLTANLGETARLEAALTFPEERNARQGADAIRFLLQITKGLGYMLEDNAETLFTEKAQRAAALKLSERLHAAIDSAVVEINGKSVRASVKVQLDAASINPLLQGLQQQEEKKQLLRETRRKLSRIGEAFHDFADERNGTLPSSMICDKDGKPLYSWRVLLLPYLGEEKLFNQLKLDEPWDSAHNKPLLAKTPKAFEMTGIKAEEGMTYFQVFQGHALAEKKGNRFPASFTDGTLTILAVEAAEPVHWAAPGDIKVTKKDEVRKNLGKHCGEFTLAVFAEGSVRQLPSNLRDATLWALITPSGDDVVGADFTDEFDEDEFDFRRGKKDKIRREYKDKK